MVAAMPNARTSLIVRCSREDAARIRSDASSQHRSVSGYLLYILERSFWVEAKASLSQPLLSVRSRCFRAARTPKVLTAIHLRCTAGEAKEIRRYAARRNMSISDFVVFSLWRSWEAIESLSPR